MMAFQDPIETLEEAAASLAAGDAQYGDALTTIAEYWSTYLTDRTFELEVDDRGQPIIVIRPIDVANMMTLFKVGRATLNPGHLDSYVDAAGYAALASGYLTDTPDEDVTPKPVPEPEGFTFEVPEGPKVRRKTMQPVVTGEVETDNDTES